MQRLGLNQGLSSSLFHLDESVLPRIFFLADIDRDGLLDIDEFIVACHLCLRASLKLDLPPFLPIHLVPYTKVGVELPWPSG